MSPTDVQGTPAGASATNQPLGGNGSGRQRPGARSLARCHGTYAAVGALTFALFVTGLHIVVIRTNPHTATPLWGAQWLFTLLFDVAILALSLALGRRIGGPLAHAQVDARSNTLAALGLGFGVLSLCILALGLAHLLYWPLFVAIALALGIWLREDLRSIWNAAWRAPQAFAASPTWKSLSIGMRATIMVMICTLIFAFICNSIPVAGDSTDFDGTSYHLAAPKLYVAAHQIIPVPDIPLADAPSALEMFAVPGLMAGIDLQMKVLDLLFGLLLGAAVYGFTRRRLHARAAPLAIVLLYLPTWLIFHGVGTVPDFATAFFAVIALDDLACWLDVRCQAPALGARAPRPPLVPDSHEPHSTHIVGPRVAHTGPRPPAVSTTHPLSLAWLDRLVQPDDILLLRGGLLAGLAVSCKLTTAPLLPAMAVSGSATCLLAGTHPWARRLGLALRVAIAPSVAALLPLAPWLLKNVVFFHNPIFPLGQVASGADCSGGTSMCVAAPSPGAQYVPPVLRSLWHVITTTGDVYWNFCGPLSVAILLALFLFRTPAARFSVLFLVFGTALWWEFVPLNLPPRYWLPMLAIGFALSAAVLTRIIERAPVQGWLAELPLLAFVFISALITLLVTISLAQRFDAFSLLSGRLSRYDFLAQRVRPYTAFDWVNTHAAPGTEVATVNTSLGYFLDVPYLNDWFGTRLARLDGNEQSRTAELQTWCTAGVRQIVFNRGVYEYNPDDAADIQPRSQFAWLRTPGLSAHVEYSWRGVDVIAVQPCRAADKAISALSEVRPRAAVRNP